MERTLITKNGDAASALIEGTRIKVIEIGIEFEYLGMTPDEIVKAHPHLDLAQVHAALSYFYEHIKDMREKLKKDESFAEKLKQRFASKLAIAA